MMGYKMTLQNANAEVMDWLDFTANARIHQTTLYRPFDMLAEEQLQLLPLPKPYHGIHPIKATAKSVTQDKQTSNRISIHIPTRDLQSYDAFIPAMTYILVPVYAVGGALWH
ncbi:hypothetical protein M947_05155 [Sulfurimonas hongkongensis]|uniref:Uncharacterized protein n=1 Tax=Sulfurimonas hongkongensis TaxID=1172190 RepID=T0KRW5_9BACT|nr:hypothetical protein [Sulfurimonas hongkongensis]EQB39714.1 hypothetical protein M947_05155 [Sulfurimonas hongkongensis]